MLKDIIEHVEPNLLTDEKIVEMLKVEAKKGLEDLYYFDKYILGFKDMEEQPHKELCDFMYNDKPHTEEETPSGYIKYSGKRKKLIMEPRGSFKSSVITVGYSLYRVVLNKNIRILIASEKLSNAQKFLGEIKGHIERNDYFRALYGTLNGKSDDGNWNQTEITVSTREKIIKEPSISTAGIDVTKVGMHYDLIIVDDPVSQSNVTSREMIEKVESWYKLLLSLLDPGGELVIIGTRWDYGDLYGTLQEEPNRELFDILVRKAVWEEDGQTKYLFPERLNKEFIDEQRRIQGTYIFSCTPMETPILMSDWSTKQISDVKVGDEVVGFVNGQGTGKNKLVKSKVTEINSRLADVYRVKMESGREIRCTKDHNWYTGRQDETHRLYAPAHIGGKLLEVVNTDINDRLYADYSYLAGMIDGEGACKYGSISIHQSSEKNPEVYARIKEELDYCKIGYRQYDDCFVLNGGRQTKFDIMRYGDPAKRDQILKTLWDKSGRMVQKKDRVKDIIFDRVETVYALTTETGNYIAWGYASKNCQYLNDPVPLENAEFKPEWFRYYLDADMRGKELNKFLTCDPAISMNKGSDYTVFVIAGVDEMNNIYILHIDKGKYLPHQICEKIIYYATHYETVDIGMETNAFQKSLKYQLNDMMRLKAKYFKITELIKNTNIKKELRIRALQPRYEFGAVFHKRNDVATNELELELLHFPRAKHDDISDCLASILEIARPPMRKKPNNNKKKKFRSKITKW